MATRDDIDAAVKAGVLSEEAAGNLTSFLGSKLPGGGKDGGPSPSQLLGEEPLRFIRNFHDIFLAIGLAALAIGLAVGVGAIMGEQLNALSNADEANVIRKFVWPTAGLLAGCAIIMWLLAEYFARHKRLFFPAIVICIAFVSFAYFSGLFAYAGLVGATLEELSFDGTDWDGVPWQLRALPIVLTGLSFFASSLFYLRFRLPFAMGAVGLSGASLFLAALFTIDPSIVANNMALVVFGLGVALFLLGMAFDVRDPSRITRFSDNGFWLHLAAAPFLLWGAPLLIFGFEDFEDLYTPEGSVIILSVLAVFALISLLVNRRALVVSGMVSTGIAMSILFREAGLGAAGLVAATLLALGGVVVLLGASWHGLRGILIKPLPKTGVIARIFPPETADG